MLSIQISTEGIVKLLKEQKPLKAPDGPDCITATVSMTCAEQVAPLLQQKFHKSLDTGELPLDWHKADVSPTFNAGKRSDPANYRPVSLTSIPCKMLEHIVLTGIMRHLEKYKVLNDEQRGFRKGRSCETKLAISVNDLVRALDRQSQADVVIMDLSKAFDLVPHQRLLSKLRHFDVTGKLHNWINIFFTNEDTTGSPRGCFFLIYNSNLRCTTREGFRPPTFYSLSKLPSRSNIHTSSSPG